MSKSGMHWLTLGFLDPELEKRFLHEHYKESLSAIRVGLGLGFLLYSAFGLLDPYIIPEIKGLAWSIRFGVICPLALITLALSFRKEFESIWQVAISLLGFIADVGIILMVIYAAVPGNYLYYAGMMLTNIFFYVSFRLRYIPATIASVSGLALFEILAVTQASHALPLPILINHTFFLLAVNITGAVTAYMLERYNRIAFLQAQVIKQQTLQLSQALEDAEEARLQAEDLSHKDPLTGLYNRRFFYSQAEKELEAIYPNGTASIIMVDVDLFKKINDTYGHVIGDQVIIAIAEVIRRAIGPNDVVCRYGGEEFAVLLPYADVNRAAQVAERLRNKVGGQAIPSAKGSVSVTVSIGVASIQPNTAPMVNQLLDQADLALYQAKQKGRNQVCIHPSAQRLFLN